MMCFIYKIKKYSYQINKQFKNKMTIFIYLKLC